MKTIDINNFTQLLLRIAISLEHSAEHSKNQLKAYEDAQAQTAVFMARREQREVEAAQRSEMDFAMAKERHEAFMRERKLREDALRNIGGNNA